MLSLSLIPSVICAASVGKRDHADPPPPPSSPLVFGATLRLMSFFALCNEPDRPELRLFRELMLLSCRLVAVVELLRLRANRERLLSPELVLCVVCVLALPEVLLRCTPGGTGCGAEMFRKCALIAPPGPKTSLSPFEDPGRA